jgi:hypothetical protein
MSCKVRSCRYPNTHITSSHKCGNCGKFGHGVRECGNIELQNHLKLHFNTNPQFHCTHERCKTYGTHTIDAHQPEFEIHPVERMFKEQKEIASKLPIGHFMRFGIGMGQFEIHRNNDGKIQVKRFDYSDTNCEQLASKYIEGYENFISGNKVPQTNAIFPIT